MPTAFKTLVQKTVAKKPAARPQRKSA
jgi:hypothetical protein